MELLLKALGIWGVADSLWIALNPDGWSRFWGGWIARAGKDATLSRSLAAAEFALSLYLIMRNGRSKAEG